jgi:hypothetical protein
MLNNNNKAKVQMHKRSTNIVITEQSSLRGVATTQMPIYNDNLLKTA